MLSLAYPRFLKTASMRLSSAKYFLTSSRGFATQTQRLSSRNRIRQKIIEEINTNPEILKNGGVTLANRRSNWKRRLVVIASSYCVLMSSYFSYKVYKAYKSEEKHTRPDAVFVPLWLGFNWPTQRHFKFPLYLQYMDSELSCDVVYKDPDYMENLRNEHVERQVLDCLFRLAVVRDTFKLPISVLDHPKKLFQIWIEPRYPTLHGPNLSVCKTEGVVSIKPKWQIRTLKGTEDLEDFVSGFSSALESLAATGAERKTHDQGSGRIHSASSEETNTETNLCSGKTGTYTIAFRGSLEVCDLSKLYTGTVSYTGIIDRSHSGIHGGVRIITMTLEVMQYGKSNKLYKIK